MRIAQVSTLASHVDRDRAASVEQMVWHLTYELEAMGHEVTVFATADSRPPARLVPTVPGPYGRQGAPDDWQMSEWVNLCRAVEHSDEFDVIHTHAYLWGIPLEPFSRAPMVHTLHVMPTHDQAFLRALRPRATVAALSGFQWSAWPDFPPAVVIPHGLDPKTFPFRAEPDDYLVYLGRFLPGKGPLAAIETARALGVRLVMAGPRNTYFRDFVAPHVDGRAVEYLGHVDAEERNALLGGARALLYPIEQPEPFGLVMIEAMLCGTPVAAIGIGAVPEIVEESVTGCTSTDGVGIVEAAIQAMALDRGTVRQCAEERFSARRMAEDYVRLFENIAAPVSAGRRET